MGRAMTLPNGLTPQQNAFKDHIINQVKKGKNPNGTQAVLDTYNTLNRKSAQMIASDNLSKPIVKKAIEDEMKSNGLSSNQLLKNLAKVANAAPEIEAKIPLKHYINVNLSLLKLLNDKKPESSHHGNNYTIINMGFTEAKKELEKMNAANSEFLDEADVVE